LNNNHPKPDSLRPLTIVLWINWSICKSRRMW